MRQKRFSRKTMTLLLAAVMFLTSAWVNVQNTSAAMYPHEWGLISSGEFYCGRCMSCYHATETQLDAYSHGTWAPDPYYGGSCNEPNASHQHAFVTSSHTENSLSGDRVKILTGDPNAASANSLCTATCSCGQAAIFYGDYIAHIPCTDYIITFYIWDDGLNGWAAYYNYHFDTEEEWESAWQALQSSNDDSMYYTRYKADSFKEEYRSCSHILTTQWANADGRWYYVNCHGTPYTGWKQVDGTWYYLGSDGAMRTGWQKIDSKWYYLGGDGAMKTGWQKINGSWYYLNSEMKTGWQKVNGQWYYLDPNTGVMVTGSRTIDGKLYTFGADGAMVSSENGNNNSGSTGNVNTGIGGQCGDNAYWSYDALSNTLTIYGTGTIRFGSWKDGIPEQCGMNTTYYNEFNTVVISEGITGTSGGAFENTDAEDVYLPSTFTQWYDCRFCLQGYAPRFHIASGADFHFDSQHHVLVKTSEKKLVMAWPESTIPSDGSVTIIGSYSFNFCGSTVADTTLVIPEVIEVIENRGIVNCMKIEYVKIMSPTTVVCDDPDAICNWRGEGQEIGIIGYPGSTAEAYAKKYGREFIPIGGWVSRGGQWYYYTGTQMATSWQQVEGKWYYFNGSGVMQSGWQKVDGVWYYLNSAMATGWKQISGSWYYFGSNGAMRTGWQKVDGSWYFFGSDGAMRSGWQKVDGVWYYLNNTMVTGWKMIDGTWYYFKSSGAMASNETLNIGGTNYSFAASGAWIH